MLGGIIFQMGMSLPLSSPSDTDTTTGTITVYATCALEFLYRYFHFRPIQGRSTAILQTRSRNNLQDATQTPGGRGILTPRLKLMILALLFNTLCLYTRAVYRTIELTDGWSGRIISTELYFSEFLLSRPFLIFYHIFIIERMHVCLHLHPLRRNTTNLNGRCTRRRNDRPRHLDSQLRASRATSPTAGTRLDRGRESGRFRARERCSISSFLSRMLSLLKCGMVSYSLFRIYLHGRHVPSLHEALSS